jgi:hypothetical protein
MRAGWGKRELKVGGRKLKERWGINTPTRSGQAPTTKSTEFTETEVEREIPWRHWVGREVGWLVNKAPLPPPRVFLQKSSELLENKRVAFLMDAKESGRV